MGRFWLSVFGVGYSPIVPGTCGSAVVMVIFLSAVLLGASPRVVTIIMLAVAAHGWLVTVAYGDRVIAQYGPDPRIIVSDEQCGQALTYLSLFWLAHCLSGGRKELIVFALAGFILFRVFDVIKPPPVRQLEAVKGAWGVLLDDVGAGVYAAIVLSVIWRFGWLKGLWS